MEPQRSGPKKLWKPPSIEDFNIESQCKRMKLDCAEVKKIKEDFENIIVEPRTIDELATHPKKIEEVKNWFELSKFSKSRILLVTGPAGSAKTVTVKVVAASLKISLREWVNPVDKSDFKTEAVQVDKSDFSESSQIDKFDDFIFRASRYKSLFDDNDRTVVLVEDFPNVFVWKPGLFHEFLDRYHRNGLSPIAFICTDDQRLNLSNDLFPSSIKIKYGISEIKFNPVNNSSLMKTLKKLAGKYNQGISAEVLQSIAHNSNGDLRNALSNFAILASTTDKNKVRKVTKARDKVKGEVELVSIKDNRAEFYQALGRVLYPKTIKMCKGGESFENEKRIFVHDVMEISDSFSEPFLKLLHENYLNTVGNLQSATNASDAFSVCDLFHREDELREYSAVIAVVGLMTSNKEPKREGFRPVKKSSAPYTASKDIFAKRFEYSTYSETYNVLNTDIIPYLKILKECRISKAIDTRNQEDDDEDNIDIEEFDD